MLKFFICFYDIELSYYTKLRKECTKFREGFLVKKSKIFMQDI